MSDGCSKIAKIAKDKKIVLYLDEWVQDSILDKGFKSVYGMHGEIQALTIDGAWVDLTPPKEKITNIKDQHFRFSIDKLPGGLDAPITCDNVGEIDIGDGRNSIILLKNGKTLQSHRGYDESSDNLMRVNGSTFAFCGNTTFKM